VLQLPVQSKAPFVLVIAKERLQLVHLAKGWSGPERKNSISEKKSSSPNHNAEGEDNGPKDVPVDTNLIQLDTDDVLATNTNATYADNDDDIIFEDFARLRLKGETEA
jgi:hypothetical protein